MPVSSSLCRLQVLLTSLPRDWAGSSRAGRDADFVHAVTEVKSDAALSGLPSGVTVKVRVSAAHNAGESRPGAEAQIVVP